MPNKPSLAYKDILMRLKHKNEAIKDLRQQYLHAARTTEADRKAARDIGFEFFRKMNEAKAITKELGTAFIPEHRRKQVLKALEISFGENLENIRVLKMIGEIHKDIYGKEGDQ